MLDRAQELPPRSFEELRVAPREHHLMSRLAGQFDDSGAEVNAERVAREYHGP